MRRQVLDLLRSIAVLGLTTALAAAGPACRGDGRERRALTDGGARPRGEAQTRLHNGLQVILRPVDGARDVALVVLFALGEDHDPVGRAGRAHLIEHLYVVAAAGRTPARTADELMAAYPAGWNAQTGARYTVVATVFPPDALGAELAEAAARMGELAPTGADLGRERERLLAEVANMFGRSGLAAGNRARALVLPPGKGGLPAEAPAITLDEVSDAWRRYYKPANALVILAGAVDARTASEAVARRFGGIASGEPAPAGRPRAAAAAGAGADAGGGDGAPMGSGGGEACAAYLAPAPGDERYAPFLVLAARLAEAGPGRFAPLDDPEVLTVCAPARPGDTPARAAAALDAIVAAAVAAPVDAGDPARVRRLFGFLLGLDAFPDAVLARNPYGVAFGLGRRAQLGIDPARLAAALARVDEDSFRRAAAAVTATGRVAVW